MTAIKDTLVGMGAAGITNAFLEKYFQLEVLNKENLPGHNDGPVMYVMNHTAFFALECYILGTFMHAQDAKINMRTLVWKGFSEGPLGVWFRGLGCETASIQRGAELLNEGVSVLIMPEGVDATDVRNDFNVFHTGFLRILKEKPVKIVPIGFTGIDNANPFWISENPKLAKMQMAGVNPDFNFAMFPKLPIFRPVKVVYNIGEAIEVTAAELETEDGVKAKRDAVKDVIVNLVADAQKHRDEKIAGSKINRLYHKVMDGKHSYLPF